MVDTSSRRLESNTVVLPRTSLYSAGSSSDGGVTSRLMSVILSIAAVVASICVVVASYTQKL